MSRGCKNKIGVTLIEILLATLLLSVVFLAVSALYVASQKFYFTTSDKVIIGYELQYAIQHIYKNAMRGIGDEALPGTSSAIQVPNSETLNIRINNSDPLTSSNYSTVSTYKYYKSGSELKFQIDAGSAESLVPKVTVTAVNFDISGKLLTGYITASYGTQSIILYFSCYPRLASFQ